MRNKILLIAITVLVLVSFIAACDKKPLPTPATLEEVAEEKSEPAAAAEETPAPANEDPNALPPEPQPVSIPSSDSVTLEGYYYPAAVENAPLVVLMHWMMGDKSDWNEVAVWLQNRGQANPFPHPGDAPWWDPSWFPEVAADKSYAVLLFSFRGCEPYEAGCQSMDKAGRLADSYAVMRFARELEGIGPSRIVAVVSSIGADGAADDCLDVNLEFPDTCQGSFSLSPGDWLGVSYVATIAQMGSLKDPITAWCVADEEEYGICEAAQGAGHPDFYKPFRVPGGDHGNMLLSPDLDPLPIKLILDFLDETLK
jgi:hypothetical protein